MASSSNDTRRVDTPHSKIIKLNVGGVKFITSLATLHMYPDSYLGHLFSGKYETHLNEEGEYFIDANGDMFVYILNFLRRGKLALPDDFHDFALLDAEVDFFQIKPLIEQIQKLKEIHNKQKQTEILAVLSPFWYWIDRNEDGRNYPVCEMVLFNSYFKCPGGSFEYILSSDYCGHEGYYDTVTKCFSDEGYTNVKKYENINVDELSCYLRSFGVKVLPDMTKVVDNHRENNPEFEEGIYGLPYTLELWTKY